MALLDWIAPTQPLHLVGHGVRLRPPKLSDHAAWAALREASRDFLQPWEPTWPADDLGKPAFRRRLAAYSRDLERGDAYPFFVFREGDGALVGYIRLFHVRRGVADMGTIGYWVGQPYARHGHTLAAVRAVCAFAFKQLNLHRVEAAVIPENVASRDLLLRAGFQIEGKARAYLKINGEWRDHLLFGRLASDPVSPPQRDASV